MASIQSLGVGSGLLTTELVDQIIAAERKATDLRLDSRKLGVDARISAFGSLRSNFAAVRDAARSLGQPATFLAATATSSAEASVAVSAFSTAREGTHSVAVTALATAHSLNSAAYDDVSTAVGTGTLSIRIGTYTRDGLGAITGFTANPEAGGGTIEIDAGSNSLAGLRDAINDAAVGVRASILNDGNGFRLVLSGTATGAAQAIEIGVTEGDSAGLAALRFDATQQALAEAVVAGDAALTVDGIAITRATNTVSGVLEGVTLQLGAVTGGSPATIRVSRDTDAAIDRIDAFVSAFNDLRSLTDELTRFDPEEGVAGLLLGDATLRGAAARISRGLAEVVDELAGTPFRSLVDVGLQTDRNNDFQLTFDAARFRTAVAADADVVAALFAVHGFSGDSQLTVLGSSPATAPGVYEVDVTRTATQGLLRGARVAGLAGPVTIDTDNRTLSVVIDGVTSGVVALDEGSYADGTALAQELQRQVNADALLKAAGKSVRVEYDAARTRLTLFSASSGSASKVSVLAVDTNTASTLGLDVADGVATAGRDVSGRIGGFAALGSANRLTAPSAAIATAGFVAGASRLDLVDGNLLVDTGNDEFSVRIDATTTVAVTLTAGTYATADALASEIQTRINTALSATGRTVEVAWDANRARLEIRSGTAAAASRVDITSVEAGFSTLTGFATGNGFGGADAGSPGAVDLRLQVAGGTGSRGSITFSRGIGARMESFLSDLLGANGALTGRLEGLDDELVAIEDERTRFNARIAGTEARLRAQFTAADALISRLNNTSDFLTQQLETLTELLRNNL